MMMVESPTRMDGAQDGQKASLGSHHPGHRDSGTRVDGYFHSFDPNHDKHETGRQHETGRHDGKLPNGDSVPHAISRVRRENTAPAAPVRATAPAQTRPRTSTVPVPASVSPIPESIEDGGPNLPTQHSPNFTLNRRGSRSIHSDLHAFAEDASITSHANEDAARWADAIRAKRAAKRRRLEEEEDNRVLVGTKVGPEHSNYSIMYNMLTGIRVGVSRCNAKVDRALTAADFSAEHKFSFDIVGSELTPSAKYDFKFKDYAPWVFRHLRQLFHLDPADYLISLTSKYILSELTSPGKSGSFFYFSRDYKFIIKTISQREHKFLRKILKEYYEHVSQNRDTLISQFYGLHRVKEPYGRKLHFVVMNNLFPPHRDIHQTYDLKGSTQGRNFQEDNLRDNPRATLKDLNWLRRHMTIHLGPRKRAAFIKQLERDVGLLKRLNIMDYSLLLGIHDMQRGNKDNIRDSTLSIVQPEPEAPPLQRTVSKLEQARKARELRRKITSTGPTAIEPSMLPADEHRERKNFAFYSDDGGLRATDEDDGPADEIYYFGVIDCLTRVRPSLSLLI